MISARANLAALYSSGTTNPLMSAVVRFYYAGSGVATKGWCSGTLLTRGIVLTAAHCLYANHTDGNGQYGYYPAAQMTVVPGNTRAGGVDVARWGNWNVASTFVPQGWADEDGGLDWGLAVIAPNAQGAYRATAPAPTARPGRRSSRSARASSASATPPAARSGRNRGATAATSTTATSAGTARPTTASPTPPRATTSSRPRAR